MGHEVLALVRRVKEGDGVAFQAIYDLFAKKIYNFVYRMLGSKEEAEDITQDSFLIAYRELKNLRKEAQFESWLYHIARNEVYQKLRHGKFLRYTLDDGKIAHAYETKRQSAELNPEETVLNDELSQAIQSALADIPDKLREVFVLAVIQKVSYKDICDIVGKSLSAVKTDIYRARLMARDALKKYLDGSVAAKPHSSYKEQ